MQERFLFYCVRVYASGNACETVRDLEGMINWLEFNRTLRLGNALFVNGNLVHPEDRGYLSEQQCQEIQSVLRSEYWTKCTKLIPEVFGPQVEGIGKNQHHYEGYPPEASRSPLFKN